MLLASACLAVRAVAVPADPADEAARVVVVANERDAESVALARHYIAARGIPAENLIALPMPSAETIGWSEFIEQIYNPLRTELVRRDWLEGITSELRDEFGRRRFVGTGHSISYLVLCRGVPLRIAHNDAWVAPAKPGMNPGLLVNAASVDSELATIAMNATALNGQIPNPLFHAGADRRLAADMTVRVARLDGPTAQAARDLVDNAIAAERTGLAGRAYVDLSGWNPMGDDWLDSIAAAFDAAGFDTDIDRDRPTMRAAARFDAPVFYFGWYDWNLNGPMAVPGFRFPPGAIAVHIHSFSAETLRSESNNWCGPLVARGATATLGNVFEPYLQLTHRLDVFATALLEGRTLGDAASVSTPVLSWQGVLIGDPLYRPSAVGLDEQWEHRAQFAAAQQTALASRKVRLLLRAGAKDEAVRIARTQFRDSPSIASGLLLAETTAATEGSGAAPPQLTFIAMLERVDPHEIGVALSAARALTGWGAHADAFEVYKRVLVPPVPPWAGEAALIEEALRAAMQAGATDGVAELEARLSFLRVPPAAG